MPLYLSPAALGAGLWRAADLGYLAMTHDPWTCNNSSNPSAGVAQLTKILLPAAISATNVLLCVGTAGAALTNAYAGVYTSAGSLVGSTADQSSSWTSTGLKTIALSGGPYNLDAGFVWVAFLCGTATTMPRMQSGQTGQSAGWANGLLAAAASRSATTGSGLSALPASFTPSALTQSGNMVWAALS